MLEKNSLESELTHPYCVNFCDGRSTQKELFYEFAYWREGGGGSCDNLARGAAHGIQQPRKPCSTVQQQGVGGSAVQSIIAHTGDLRR